MSNQVFPQLAGLSIERKKTPEWKTVVHQSVNGKESRTTMMSSPIWNFELNYNALRTNTATDEVAELIGFYNQMNGSYDTFLYLDPYDNTVTSQNIAVGDGTSTQFQLIRNIGGAIEPIQNVNGTPSIYLNGVSQSSGYTVGSTGIVTFATAPSVGVVISWSGSFYFRCRFVDDSIDFNQFLYNIYELKSIKLRSVKL